jgi:hypothetical protein
VTELLAGVLPVIFEETHVLDARITLQIEDALRGKAQELSDLIVTRAPKMAIMPGILD